jgi:hypothetical protein
MKVLVSNITCTLRLEFSSQELLFNRGDRREHRDREQESSIVRRPSDLKNLVEDIQSGK